MVLAERDSEGYHITLDWDEVLERSSLTLTKDGKSTVLIAETRSQAVDLWKHPFARDVASNS